MNHLMPFSSKNGPAKPIFTSSTTLQLFGSVLTSVFGSFFLTRYCSGICSNSRSIIACRINASSLSLFVSSTSFANESSEDSDRTLITPKKLADNSSGITLAIFTFAMSYFVKKKQLFFAYVHQLLRNMIVYTNWLSLEVKFLEWDFQTFRHQTLTFWQFDCHLPLTNRIRFGCSVSSILARSCLIVAVKSGNSLIFSARLWYSISWVVC